MGIDNNFLHFLADATKSGLRLTRTATLGRQNFYRITAPSLVAELRAVGISLNASEAAAIMNSNGIYADALLRFLGAELLDSFDFSDYEKATHVVDMNKPIDPSYHEQYTTVLDGGSLEHIFNFPQAIANCMQMVAEGGHFVAFCPANNFFGHGFYQFSAELFFRVFSPANGFVTERMVLVEDDQVSRGWFEVRDPQAVRQRVTLMSATPCHLFVMARRTAKVKPFAAFPYQSDYVTVWDGRALSQEGAQVKHIGVLLRDAMRRYAPHRLKEWMRNKLFPGPRSRPDFYTPTT